MSLRRSSRIVGHDVLLLLVPLTDLTGVLPHVIIDLVADLAREAEEG
jgi:hypothetical protein